MKVNFLAAFRLPGSPFLPRFGQVVPPEMSGDAWAIRCPCLAHWPLRATFALDLTVSQFEGVIV
eukprot:8412076-Pyramimonas_sp.AAC.1